MSQLHLNNIKRSATLKKNQAPQLLSEDKVVTPRDVQITITQEEDSKEAWTDDPIGKALKDMKDLFNSKLSIQWSRGTRQTYDSIE